MGVIGLPWQRTGGYAVLLILTQLAFHTVSQVPLSAEYLALSLIGGALAAWILSVLFKTLPLKRIERLTVVCSSLFIIQVFADLIEGEFFTTIISNSAIFLGGALIGVGITFLESLSGLLLFPFASSSQSLGSILKPFFRRGQWLFRWLVGAVAYLPVYFMFGALVSPFVIPYYTDPSLGLGLTIPNFYVLISVELLRGFLFVLALVPIVVTVKLSRKAVFVVTALFLYVIGAYVPFVAGTTLPWTLKFYHSLEIFADSLVYGAILTYLFK